MNDKVLVACGECVHIMPPQEEYSSVSCDLSPLTYFNYIAGEHRRYGYDLCSLKNKTGECPHFEAGQTPHMSKRQLHILQR